MGTVGPSGQPTYKFIYRGESSGREAEQPIPMWVQAFARTSADVSCPDGWAASWDQWPNNGKGGFVCQRSIKSFGTD